MGMDIKRFGAKLNKGVIAFSNNVIIKTIASGMARLLPVTIVGSIATLLISLPFEPYLNVINSTGISKFLLLGSTMTNDIISIYLVIALSYEMSRIYKKSQINAVATALLAFFLVTPMTAAMIGEKTANVFTTTYLGSRGMFVGIIVGLLATRLYVLFIDKGIKIKMHPSVPPAIAGSFESLFPIIGVAGVFIIINAIFSATSYGDVHSLIYGLLQKPLAGAGASIWTMLLICFLGEVFWWFGIHGSNVTRAVSSTLYLPPAIDNATALAAGMAMPFILNEYFLNIYKGPRHLALACMLLWMSKSKQLKAIGQVAIVPGVFGISEPMKFGIPMVYNPIIFIPMAMTPVVSVSIAYFATVIGFLPRVGVNIPWAMPPIIGGMIAGGWRGALIQIVQFFVCILIYIPFFKVLDKQKAAEEAEKGDTVKG